MSLVHLRNILLRHESLELKPYTDSVGKLTIGIGRNLTDNGISRDEALQMLENDITRCFIEARKISWWRGLDPVRQEVVICMLFNMGPSRFSTFVKFAEFMKQREFKSAAEEMLKSKWSDQVGKRATELALMMHEGNYDLDD